jgi:Big-like domain-containing protein
MYRIRRSDSRSATAPWLVTAAVFVLIGCSEKHPTAPAQRPLSTRLLVSAPVGQSGAFSLADGSVARSVAASAAALYDSLVYVSMPPGAIPGAESVTVHNLATGRMLTVRMVDGGFDPAPIAAMIGDTLEVEVYGRTTVVAVEYSVVLRRRPPTIVRTDPPKGKTDVSLNTHIGIVFSEPVDPATVGGTVRLFSGSTPVAGTVTLSPSGIVADFAPDSPLAPHTTYELVVDTGVRNLRGDALELAVQVSFTTINSSAGALDVFAVGMNGTIVHYDGTTWSSQTSGTSADLFGVWGASGSDVYAVGRHGTVLHYDGSRWDALPTSDTTDLIAVWGSSGRDLFAVGSFGTILHFDGTSWTRHMNDSTLVFEGVWGSSANDVFVVGYNGVILHYNGAKWTVQRSNATIDLFGLWGTSGTDVFAVGDSILHFDGTSWSAQRESATYGIWGSSGNDVYTVGDYGSILHYDGAGWTLKYVGFWQGGATEYDGVWGFSSNDIFAVGRGGGILHYDGTSWVVQTSGTSEYLWGVWGSSRSK